MSDGDEEHEPGQEGGEDLEDEEEMRKRHRQEARSLEGKTRAMLKKAPKPKKAEVESEVKRLEEELARKHEEELKALVRRQQAAKGGSKGVSFLPPPDDPGLPAQAEEGSDEEEGEDAAVRASRKRDKAKKKKEKKAQRAAEEEAKREAERDEILKGAVNFRELEMGRLLEVLSPLGLGVHEIQADGHCLYRAVAHQLSSVRGGSSSHDYTEMRRAAAAYMRSEPSDFLPFLDTDTTADHQDLQEAYEAYCQKVEATAEWGGQLELRALVPIVVYSADQPPVEMGAEYEGQAPPLKLTFHRHYYTLGEHYNAVVPLDSSGGSGGAR